VSRRRNDPNTEIRSIVYDGYTRTYRVNIPDSYESSASNALVFVLHGGGGSSEGMENSLTLKGFNKLAATNNFIVVYPEGIENHWNDGRQNLPDNASQLDIDDVGFLSLLIDRLSNEFNIKDNNVFFTGISNGGFMCYRLGFEIPDKIKAVAPVTATLSVDLLTNYTPNGTISIGIMCGTNDPLVPYEGGTITIFNQTRGEIISVNDTVEFWVENNKCNTTPEIYEYPDVDPNDGTRVILEKYTAGINGTRVYLYAILGGGHTWPGGYQYFPEWFIGKTCRDIDANKVLWEFFNELKDKNL
jgi:polyhydroxybutyrate depolymerase